jgi:Fe-S oxidoreductase
MFLSEKCDECGNCLTECQYIDYSHDQAIQEIRALKEGNDALILKKCITCMACNEYCPRGANPYDLIVKLQEEKHIELVPEEKLAFIERTLTGVPNEIIEGEPDKPALNLCVMEHAYPANMTEGQLFDGLTRIRGGDYFSRIVYLHTGMESRPREHAQSFIDNLAHLNKQEIIFVHDDCYTMAAKKAPEYGIRVPFKPVSIIGYMVSYLKKHQDAIFRLKKRIAYQRPCIARYNSEQEGLLDEFFNLIGVERIGRTYDRKTALCCGIGLRETDPERSAAILEKNLNDAIDNGAEAMVFSCPSCFCFMSQPCEEEELSSIFITDLCRMALGELPFSSRPWRGL